MSILKLKKIAEELDGREYLDEDIDIDFDELKEKGIVVIYGRGDDLIEFRGAIFDELRAYHKKKIYLSKDGLCDESISYIDVQWDVKDISWSYKTNIRYATGFNIMEDGKVYCRGLVIDLNYAFQTEWDSQMEFLQRMKKMRELRIMAQDIIRGQ